METGTLPITQIITSRRLNYLKHILDKNENELIKRIYNEQKEDPIKGDWFKLVQTDLESIDPNLDEKQIMLMSKKNNLRHT